MRVLGSTYVRMHAERGSERERERKKRGLWDDVVLQCNTIDTPSDHHPIMRPGDPA